MGSIAKTRQELSEVLDELRRERIQGQTSQGDQDSLAKRERWVRMECRFPEGAAHVIRGEFERIGGLLQLKDGLSPSVKRGLILEYICINSALTPLKSLE